jgi:hypothetical protein
VRVRVAVACRQLQIPALQLPLKGQWVGAQGGNSAWRFCEATGVHKIPGVLKCFSTPYIILQ